MHCFSRRKLLIAGAAALAQSVARSQPGRRRVYRVSIMHTAPLFNKAFVARLNGLGYVVGDNLRVEEAVDTNVADALAQLPSAAAEAAQRRSDLIFAGGGAPVVRAIQNAAPATPLVMLFIDVDPVSAGLVKSFAHPGGNVTGIYSQNVALAGKRLQLLKEAIPSVSRVAVLFDESTRDQLEAAREAATALRMTLVVRERHGPNYDFDDAVRSAAKEGANALLILSSAQFFDARSQISAIARELRLPSMGNPLFADSGALLGYGPDFPAMFAKAAEYADKILRGSRPADLAVDQADLPELIVNARTAAAIGIKLAPSFEARAHRVIR